MLQVDPSLLDRTYVGAPNGSQVPLSQVARFERGTAPLAVRHQGQYPAATISFNVKPALRPLAMRRSKCKKPRSELRLLDNVRTEFAGNCAFLAAKVALLATVPGSRLA